MEDHSKAALIWNYKTREELREALENEIRSFTVDKVSRRMFVQETILHSGKVWQIIRDLANQILLIIITLWLNHQFAKLSCVSVLKSLWFIRKSVVMLTLVGIMLSLKYATRAYRRRSKLVTII